MCMWHTLHENRWVLLHCLAVRFACLRLSQINIAATKITQEDVSTNYTISELKARALISIFHLFSKWGTPLTISYYEASIRDKTNTGILM